MLLTSVLRQLRIAYWKRRYRVGRTVAHFIARDIRREIEVVDTSLIESGVILARIRTWNLLHASIRGIRQPPPFDEARVMEIKDLWTWTGKPWGGPVPDSSVPPVQE
jgi:hypothetical protein